MNCGTYCTYSDVENHCAIEKYCEVWITLKEKVVAKCVVSNKMSD